MKKVIGIVGPTAVGKTALSVLLAHKIGAEIVSADVMQAYRLFDIGTAKATVQERQKIPHHMIDVFSPNENINLSVYSKKAQKEINEILRRNENAILVGGSGLYFDSIIYQSYSFSGAETDPDYREKLYRIARKQGNLCVYELLQSVDPEYAQATHPNNLKRVIRALEYFQSSGRKKSDQKREQCFRYQNTVVFGLFLDRAQLYARIDRRVDQMVAHGLIEEVKSLIESGYTNRQNAMQAIGYKEIGESLQGKCTLDEAIARVKQHSRNYAKRQYTWFRRNPDICWIDVERFKTNDKIIAQMESIIDGSN